MATSKYLRRLKSNDSYSDVTKRFVEFCQNDIKVVSLEKNFDATIYEDAVRLVINKLQEGEKTAEDKQG